MEGDTLGREEARVRKRRRREGLMEGERRDIERKREWAKGDQMVRYLH